MTEKENNPNLDKPSDADIEFANLLGNEDASNSLIDSFDIDSAKSVAWRFLEAQTSEVKTMEWAVMALAKGADEVKKDLVYIPAGLYMILVELINTYGISFDNFVKEGLESLDLN